MIENDDGRPGLAGASEQAILVFGMGRGGDAVFAVDVTNPDLPRAPLGQQARGRRLWDLGQTWSPPVAARVDCRAIPGCTWPSSGPDVLFFGGGYDPKQDGTHLRSGR